MGDVRERPVLFSSAMVRAILEGRKTQTRRVVRGYKNCLIGEYATLSDDEMRAEWNDPQSLALGPYGVPGDRLWVRETHMRWNGSGTGKSVIYCADGAWIDHGFDPARVMTPHDMKNVFGAKVPSIFMPRWASRITLEVTGVRVERLGAITESDARAEGILAAKGGWTTDKNQPISETAVRAYEDLWHSINGSWLPDTWVWVVEFRKLP